MPSVSGGRPALEAAVCQRQRLRPRFPRRARPGRAYAHTSDDRRRRRPETPAASPGQAEPAAGGWRRPGDISRAGAARAPDQWPESPVRRGPPPAGGNRPGRPGRLRAGGTALPPPRESSSPSRWRSISVAKFGVGHGRSPPRMFSRARTRPAPGGHAGGSCTRPRPSAPRPGPATRPGGRAGSTPRLRPLCAAGNRSRQARRWTSCSPKLRRHFLPRCHQGGGGPLGQLPPAVRPAEEPQHLDAGEPARPRRERPCPGRNAANCRHRATAVSCSTSRASARCGTNGRIARKISGSCAQEQAGKPLVVGVGIGHRP